MKNKISRAFFIGAAFYTVTTAIILFISVIINLDKALDPRRFLLILLFSCIAAAAQVIGETPSIPSAAGHLIAGAGFIGGFFFCVILPAYSGFTSAVIFTVAVSAIYVAARIAIMAISNKNKATQNQASKKSSEGQAKSPARKSKKQREEEEYQSMFSSGGDKK